MVALGNTVFVLVFPELHLVPELMMKFHTSRIDGTTPKQIRKL